MASRGLPPARAPGVDTRPPSGATSPAHLVVESSRWLVGIATAAVAGGGGGGVRCRGWPCGESGATVPSGDSGAADGGSGGGGEVVAVVVAAVVAAVVGRRRRWCGDGGRSGAGGGGGHGGGGDGVAMAAGAVLEAAAATAAAAMVWRWRQDRCWRLMTITRVRVEPQILELIARLCHWRPRDCWTPVGRVVVEVACRMRCHSQRATWSRLVGRLLGGPVLAGPCHSDIVHGRAAGVATTTTSTCPWRAVGVVTTTTTTCPRARRRWHASLQCQDLATILPGGAVAASQAVPHGHQARWTRRAKLLHLGSGGGGHAHRRVPKGSTCGGEDTLVAVGCGGIGGVHAHSEVAACAWAPSFHTTCNCPSCCSGAGRWSCLHRRGH